eukprot:351952-Pelagomonas_calceolata.AAC.1
MHNHLHDHLDRQAVYCLSKAIAHDVKDADARWDRAVLYAELGEQAKAIRQFQMVRLPAVYGGDVNRVVIERRGGAKTWERAEHARAQSHVRRRRNQDMQKSGAGRASKGDPAVLDGEAA